MVAIKNGHYDIVDRLLQYNIDINHSNRFGDTALMIAIKYSHIGIAKRLFINIRFTSLRILT